MWPAHSSRSEQKNRYVKDNKSFTQTGSVQEIGREVVGRPATGLQEITLFRSGLPKVAFLHVHTGRDGKILTGGGCAVGGLLLLL